MPVLFHCTAGKDRTGMASALILYSLGADENTIMRNYLMSNEFLQAKYGDLVNRFPRLKPLLEVKPEYLQAGIDAIKTNYGSVENYLVDILGVDIGRMREIYLY